MVDLQISRSADDRNKKSNHPVVNRTNRSNYNLLRSVVLRTWKKNGVSIRTWKNEDRAARKRRHQGGKGSDKRVKSLTKVKVKETRTCTPLTRIHTHTSFYLHTLSIDIPSKSFTKKTKRRLTEENQLVNKVFYFSVNDLEQNGWPRWFHTLTNAFVSSRTRQLFRGWERQRHGGKGEKQYGWKRRKGKDDKKYRKKFLTMVDCDKQIQKDFLKNSRWW